MIIKYKLFSIILAVRNKENYISEAIISCINQSIDADKFEIIVVNDASTDKSKNKIESLVNQFDNFTLINLKKKVGPGIARNHGIKVAQGKFILFLDGDDQLKTDTLKIISKKILLNPEIITFNFDKIFNKNKKKLLARKDFSLICKNKIKLITNFLSGEIDGSVIFTCYNKIFLLKNNIKFPKGLHEDIIFIFKCYLFAKKIIKIRKSLYLKNEVKNSITATISYERINDLLSIHMKLIRVLKEKKLYTKDMLNKAMRGFVGYMADSLLEVKKDKKLSNNKKTKIIRLIIKKSLFFSKLKLYKFKTKKDFIFKKFIY